MVHENRTTSASTKKGRQTDDDDDDVGIAVLNHRAMAVNHVFQRFYANQSPLLNCHVCII